MANEIKNKVYTIAEGLQEPQKVKALLVKNAKDIVLVHKFPFLEQLQCIWGEETIRWDLIKAEIVKLQTLKELHLVYQQVDNQMIQAILALPQLKVLKLELRQQSRKKIDISWLSQLGKLVNLTHLSIKRHKLTDLPDSIYQLINLKELSLAGNKFTNLPFQAERFPTLEIIGLEANKITHLPDGFLNFKKLQKLNLAGNPIAKNPLYRDGTPVVQFLNKIKSLPAHLPNIAWAVFTDNTSQIAQASDQDLCALLSIELKAFQQKVHILLNQRLTDPFLSGIQPSETNICLLGNLFFGMKRQALIERLQAQQITVHTKLQPGTTHLVVGENLTQNNISTIYQTSLPFATAEHLRQWLEMQEQPFLKEADDSMAENLRRLLFSGSEDNIKLALQMIATGGIPASILYHVFCMCFYKIWRVYNPAPDLRRVFEQTGPFEMVQLVKKHWQKENKRLVEVFMQEQVIDKKLLFDTAFEMFLTSVDTPLVYDRQTFDPSTQYNDWWKYFFRSLIIQISYKADDLAEYALVQLQKENIFQRIAQHNINLLYPWLETKGKIQKYAASALLQDQTLDIRDSWFSLLSLPIYTPVERLVVYEHTMSGMNKQIIEHLSKIEHLKTIEVHKNDINWNIDNVLADWQHYAPQIQIIRINTTS
ncbi:leucine-rich repeat domain-containing protein [Cytophagaceae bacterium YF14B1]|uniref:Leucine-rich repeat domain-containing protein n=1 Tax=Xanthocytophaga flava TaxID=3048013 RepID=A0AAE3QYZ1_9BACT|nr:leucine-rich repeat domain-containing protein [Xanthocytophaga flavus]MDJ1485816.1 leucine-rich repeat domain-containing protein [Xanthocytophaga flavus]